MAKEEAKAYTNKPKVEQIESTETYSHELFTIVNHNGEFLIALGNQVVSKEKFTSREEAQYYVDRKPWELIVNTVAQVVLKITELENQKQ